VSTTAPEDLGSEAKRYGDGRVTVLDVKLLDSSGTPVNQLEVDQSFEIQISVRVNASLPNLAWGYSMRDLKGQMLVAMMSTSDLSCDSNAVSKDETLVLSVKGTNALHAGVYTIAVGIELPVMTNLQHVFLEVVEHALVFRSIWPADPTKLFPGLVKVPAEFAVLARSGANRSALAH
jgi:lipopolysaccharide transport system ATP-binding protein